MVRSLTDPVFDKLPGVAVAGTLATVTAIETIRRPDLERHRHARNQGRRLQAGQQADGQPAEHRDPDDLQRPNRDSTGRASEHPD